jgi:hypothetical protein
MSEVHTQQYTKNSHIILKEGIPLPYFTPCTNQKMYATTDSSVFLASIRKGFYVYHYYVSEQRALELTRENTLCDA